VSSKGNEIKHRFECRSSQSRLEIADRCQVRRPAAKLRHCIPPGRCSTRRGLGSL